MTQTVRRRDRRGRLAAALAIVSTAGWVSGACATAGQHADAAPAPARTSGIDCGFGAPTSCWTLAPRFPETSPSRADTLLRAPPARVLVDASP